MTILQTESSLVPLGSVSFSETSWPKEIREGVRYIPATYVYPQPSITGSEQYVDFGIFKSITAPLQELVRTVARLETELANLRRQTNAVIGTLSPEPYILRRSIPVHIRPSGENYIATFFDANISTSGETEEEAFSNLKSLLTDSFEYLDSVPEEQLGPEPLRQLGVLREFIGTNQ
jgi:hypothetical protein